MGGGESFYPGDAIASLSCSFISLCLPDSNPKSSTQPRLSRADASLHLMPSIHLSMIQGPFPYYQKATRFSVPIITRSKLGLSELKKVDHSVCGEPSLCVIFSFFCVNNTHKKINTVPVSTTFLKNKISANNIVPFY